MGLFDNKEQTNKKMIDSLLNIKDNEELFKKITILQNEISVGFNTKVVAITSIKGDDVQSAFAHGFGEAYGLNGSKALVVDANLYNPSLGKLLNNGNSDIEIADKDKEYQITFINDKLSALCLSKEIYPSEVFKSGLIQKAIKEHQNEFDHFILIVPEIKDHKEIFLLNDIIESIILLTFKSRTKKKDIFEAIQFFEANKLPLAKTVVLK